jgi:hypothetical protein
LWNGTWTIPINVGKIFRAIHNFRVCGVYKLQRPKANNKMVAKSTIFVSYAKAQDFLMMSSV